MMRERAIDGRTRGARRRVEQFTFKRDIVCRSRVFVPHGLCYGFRSLLLNVDIEIHLAESRFSITPRPFVGFEIRMEVVESPIAT